MSHRACRAESILIYHDQTLQPGIYAVVRFVWKEHAIADVCQFSRFASKVRQHRIPIRQGMPHTIIGNENSLGSPLRIFANEILCHNYLYYLTENSFSIFINRVMSPFTLYLPVI